MSNVGCRIFLKIDRPSQELIDGFRGLPVANIGDEMNRICCMNARIRPFNDIALLGTAFTLKVRPTDNLMLQKALALAQPGDVLVVDAQGDLTNAATGEIMMIEAAVKGLAGVVIDGAIRDAAGMKNVGMPVYAAGVQPNGPYKDGPGEINVPVTCGGVIVYPGDIIVGDSDGIIVIDPAEAPMILERAEARKAKEEAIIQGIKDRIPRDKTWIDKALEKVGCEIIDDYCRGRR